MSPALETDCPGAPAMKKFRRDGTWETHELEYEADLFAAELLIPKGWVEASMKRAEKEHEHLDIDALAEEFQVGTREMEKRLRQLGLLRGEVLGRMYPPRH